jgi:hypothetical protein
LLPQHCVSSLRQIDKTAADATCMNANHAAYTGTTGTKEKNKFVASNLVLHPLYKNGKH